MKKKILKLKGENKVIIENIENEENSEAELTLNTRAPKLKYSENMQQIDGRVIRDLEARI